MSATLQPPTGLTGSALEIAIAFRCGAVTPQALVEQLLARIAEDGDARTFVWVAGDRARAEAQAAGARIAQGRALGFLDGIPVAWKDNIDLAGAPSRAGSPLMPTAPVADDADCVANAAEAGVVNLGKLNMSELAYTGLGLNSYFGTPRNIHGPDHVPGGSSSGSAAAVAHGQVALGIGTDTGGSVRLPAAFNGVVGYKSSEGRISTRGVVPLSRSLDTVGILARSVADCVLGDIALRGALASPVRRPRIADVAVLVPSNLDLAACAEAVSRNFSASLDLLRSAGAPVSVLPVPELDEVRTLIARYGTLTAAEAYLEYQAMIDGADRGDMDPNIVRRMLDGKAMLASDLLSIQRARAALVPRIRERLAGRLLAMPTTPITAPRIEAVARDADRFRDLNLTSLQFTALGNVLDLCGVALPNGFDGGGLPTSILLNAPGGEDEQLLGAALAIEAVLETGAVAARRSAARAATLA
ncbi:amidase [Xanthobacter dioxanivorans]|uniref:Indoleacetamide hydrolase n=1 Tax=Xanthobacter dioxanivorans TaxID=2528964 RepID=A0A974PSL7_9HYPH|nr:amidase family protein [Xanthobacter dioxanivorans]QRG08955.1 amidase [Xanthobacter dioxanivorans]